MSLRTKAALFCIALYLLLLPGSQAPVFSSIATPLYIEDAFGQQTPAVYLGNHLALTSAAAVLGESYLWNPATQQSPPAALIPPRQMFASDIADNPPGFLCNALGNNISYTTTLPDNEAACYPYDLTTSLSLITPEEQTIAITQALYIDRVHDIALLELERVSLPPTVASVPVDVSPLDVKQELLSMTEQRATVTATAPVRRSNPAHGGFDGSQQAIQVIPITLLDVTPPPNATPYFSRYGFVGFQWETTSDQAFMNPVVLWYHMLWQANDTLQHDGLRQVLENAVIPAAGVIGRPTLDDPVAPTLGNEGYDVLHYNLALQIDPATRQLDGDATLDMRATYHRLAAFSLDFVGLSVDAVSVNGQPAAFDVTAEKLIIKLAEPIDYGQQFRVTVGYGGVLEPLNTRFSRSFTVGLEYDDTPPRLAFANQPDGARTWYPTNDHPQDRATYTFRITVPQPYTAVANGVLIATTPTDTHTTFVWEMLSPMASNLSIVAIGDYTVLEETVSDDVTVTNYVYSDAVTESADVLSTTARAFALTEDWFGPYPFSSYGHVATPLPDGAIETQTMVMLPRNLHLSTPDAFFDLIVHELAHHWYGNTVTLHSWQDIWLNEGFATYAEWLAFEAESTPEQFRQFLGAQERVALRSTRQTPLAYPLPVELFSRDSYVKGAWILHMLRQQLGDTLFFDILRTWAVDYTHQTVTTLDFFRHVEHVSGADLTQFRRQWLYQPYIPTYQIFWSQSEGEIRVLACNLRSNSYQLELHIALSGTDDEQKMITFNLANNTAQTFDVDFIVTDINIDPDQHLLGQFSVERDQTAESCLSLIE